MLFYLSYCIHSGFLVKRGGESRGGSRRGSLGGHILVGGGTVILGLFLVFVKPMFLEV